MSAYYLTTAIDYANGKPHLGHAYEKVLTDVLARFRRLMGEEVFFLTGLDEHGQKVQQSARVRGISPQALCDEMAVLYQDLCARLDLSHNDYIRTTEERHQRVVRAILQKLFDQGDIYYGEYEGYYSVRQEQFVQEKEKVDGQWPDLFGEVITISEPNYYFRLAKYQDWLIEFLQQNAFVFPAFRQKQVLEFLKEPINDLCISRPVERLEWGIPLPFDEKFVTYVWFDALLNYVSAVGYGEERFAHYWPATFNVIGKDILVPSHAVYWPIMLHAAGIEPPKGLLVHGWWHMGGQKISKSSSVQVDPLELLDTYGADAFRYFVMREMSIGQDSDFTTELYLSRYESDLANDLGNLTSRLLNMGHRYFGGTLPAATLDEEPEQTLRGEWERTGPEIVSLNEAYQFHTGLERSFTFIRSINRYAEVRQPWKLAKDKSPEAQAALATSLATMAEGLRLAAASLAHVIPSSAARIYQLLGLGEITSWPTELTWSNKLDGTHLGEKTILFPKPAKEKSEG